MCSNPPNNLSASFVHTFSAQTLHPYSVFVVSFRQLHFLHPVLLEGIRLGIIRNTTSTIWRGPLQYPIMHFSQSVGMPAFLVLLIRKSLGREHRAVLHNLLAVSGTPFSICLAFLAHFITLLLKAGIAAAQRKPANSRDIIRTTSFERALERPGKRKEE